LPDDQNQGGQQNDQNQGGQQQQQQPDGWIATLPEELRAAPAVKKFKGKDWNEVGPQVLKSYVNLEKWQIPGENATPEERAAYARRRGVPEKIEDFKVEPKVPAGVPWSPEAQADFVKFAHAEGLTPREANAVLNYYLENAGRGMDLQTTQTAKAIEETHAGLQKKWGADYKRNVGLVARGIEEYGSASFNELLDHVVIKGPDGKDVKLGNHPVMLEFLKFHGEQRLEAGMIDGGTLLTTQADAAKELEAYKDEIRSKGKEHPYMKGDAAAKKKMTELMQRAYPEQKRD
jgi:hypothetical protein